MRIQQLISDLGSPSKRAQVTNSLVSSPRPLIFLGVMKGKEGDLSDLLHEIIQRIRAQTIFAFNEYQIALPGCKDVSSKLFAPAYIVTPQRVEIADVEPSVRHYR